MVIYLFILKINWFVKNALTNALILSKDEDIIFLKENYRRYNINFV